MSAFERYERTSQHGEIAIEVEVLGSGGVFLKERIAHPMIADLTPSPVASDELAKSLGSLRWQAAHMMTERFFLAAAALLMLRGPTLTWWLYRAVG